MKQNFLITGGTGFIGANIAMKLLAAGNSVHILTKNGPKNFRKPFIKGAKIYKINILDTSLRVLLSKIEPDFVFHLSVYGAVSSENDFKKMVETNIMGTSNLIMSLPKTVRLFVNTGSSAEYKPSDHALNENSVIEPINDYGVTKAAQTLLCQKIALYEKKPIVTFRLFSPFGPLEDKSRLVSYSILQSIKNKNLLLSNPQFVRDFIYVEDVINAYLTACKNIPKFGEIFNIGSGKDYTIAEVVNKIIKISKSSSSLKWGMVEKQGRQIEPKVWRADITKSQKVLGWKPKYNLSEGLKNSIDWFLKNHKIYA